MYHSIAKTDQAKTIKGISFIASLPDRGSFRGMSRQMQDFCGKKADVIGNRINKLCDTNPTKTPTIRSDKSYISILCFLYWEM